MLQSSSVLAGLGDGPRRLSSMSSSGLWSGLACQAGQACESGGRLAKGGGRWLEGQGSWAWRAGTACWASPSLTCLCRTSAACLSAHCRRCLRSCSFGTPTASCTPPTASPTLCPWRRALQAAWAQHTKAFVDVVEAISMRHEDICMQHASAGSVQCESFMYHAGAVRCSQRLRAANWLVRSKLMRRSAAASEHILHVASTGAGRWPTS